MYDWDSALPDVSEKKNAIRIDEALSIGIHGDMTISYKYLLPTPITFLQLQINCKGLFTKIL